MNLRLLQGESPEEGREATEMDSSISSSFHPSTKEMTEIGRGRVHRSALQELVQPRTLL